MNYLIKINITNKTQQNKTMAINYSKFLSGGTTKKKKKINYSRFLGTKQIKKEPVKTEPLKKETLDTKFQERQTQANIKSLAKFGLGAEKAKEIKGVTPMKTIRAFGGEARAESYYGREGIKTPRVSIDYDRISERDKTKRFDILGTLRAEIDHIMPKGLGGTDSDINLKTEKANRNILDIIKKTPTNELAQYKRQAGRLPAELKIIEDYKNGTLTQVQALDKMGKLKKTDVSKLAKEEATKMAIKDIYKIGEIGEKAYNIYTKTIEKGVGYLGAGVGYLTGGTLEYLRTGDKEKAQKQAILSAKQTQQFGEGVGDAGARIAPVAYTAPILLDAAILYSVGTDVKSASEEAGVKYEESESGMLATETGIRALGSRGLEKLGISPKKADEFAENPLLAGTGLFVEVLLTKLASKGATTKFSNALLKKGKFIDVKTREVSTKEFQDLYKQAGKPIPKDLPQGKWKLTEIKATAKTKLLVPTKNLKLPNKFYKVKFTPSKTLGTAETQLTNLNNSLTKTNITIPTAKSPIATSAVEGGIISQAAKPTIKISGVKPIVKPIEPTTAPTQKPQETVSEVKPTKTITDKVSTSLSEQAKKAKSVEEFVNNIGKNYFIHGTKANFDIFDTSKFQTGEGMAAWGKGMYVGDNFDFINKQYTKFGEGKTPQVFLVKKEGLNIISPEKSNSIEIWKKIAKELKSKEFNLPELANKIENDIANKKYVNDEFWNEEYLQDLNWDNYDIYDKVMKRIGIDGIGDLSPEFTGIDKTLDVGQNTGIVLFEPEKLNLIKTTKSQLEQIYKEAHKTEVKVIKKINKPVKKTKELEYKPIKEVKKTSPTIKETKVGKSIEAKAIDKGILSGLEEIAEYNATTIKEQTKIFDKFIQESSKEDVLQVVKGNEPLPEGLKGATLLVGLENYAMKKGDAELLLELARSPIATETSEAGQTLRLIRERRRDSVSAKIYRIKRMREANAKRRLKERGKSVTEVKKSIKRSAKQAITKEKISLSEWDNFIQEIKC